MEPFLVFASFLAPSPHLRTHTDDKSAHGAMEMSIGMPQSQLVRELAVERRKQQALSGDKLHLLGGQYRSDAVAGEVMAPHVVGALRNLVVTRKSRKDFYGMLTTFLLLALVGTAVGAFYWDELFVRTPRHVLLLVGAPAESATLMEAFGEQLRQHVLERGGGSGVDIYAPPTTGSGASAVALLRGMRVPSSAVQFDATTFNPLQPTLGAPGCSMELNETRAARRDELTLLGETTPLLTRILTSLPPGGGHDKAILLGSARSVDGVARLLGGLTWEAPGLPTPPAAGLLFTLGNGTLGTKTVIVETVYPADGAASALGSSPVAALTWGDLEARPRLAPARCRAYDCADW